MSQYSCSSARSSIPEGLVRDQDDDFITEIERVDELYFSNVEVPEMFDEDGDDDYDDDTNNDAIYVSSTSPLESLSNVCESDRPVDRRDVDTINKFRENGCGCSKLYGKPCSQVIDLDQAIDYRFQCKEMTSDELDLSIKVQLSAHRKDLSHASQSRSKKQQLKDRERASQTYFVLGSQVCRETFLFSHGISKNKLLAIASSLDKDGLKPRVHGNTGKTPKLALSLNNVEQIVNFLAAYANKNGLPLPGRLPSHREHNVILLPSDKTKADIHEMYNQAAHEQDMRTVCLSEFKKIWQQQCPNIVICKPATDLCAKCQLFSHKIAHSGNLSEEDKNELLHNYSVHLEKAKSQRDYYRKQCDHAKEAYSSMNNEQKQRGQSSCAYHGVQHYSFDFAQQIHYPHYAQQVGPLFFRTPRKCQCFGVCSEGSGTQIFYLIDEAECTGKGANCVTSLLHHHFQYHGFGETDVQLQMDNCSGQNKNNTVIWYGLWRTMTGLHNSVEFSLMEAGHTKFDPDWHFGLFKSKWRHSTAETMEQIAATVLNSSRNKHNIPQLVQDEEKPVVFYDWSTYLNSFFRTIPSLKKYHHFRISKETPGVVYMKEYAFDNEVSVCVLKKNSKLISSTDEPQVIVPKGLDATRQWYLYDEIRQFCLENNSSCPKPLVPKPCTVKEETVVKRKISCKK